MSLKVHFNDKFLAYLSTTYKGNRYIIYMPRCMTERLLSSVLKNKIKYAIEYLSNSKVLKRFYLNYNESNEILVRKAYN